MPYDNMRNPGNPGSYSHDEMSHEEKKKELCMELDHICTYLFAGCLWNLRAANGSRKIHVRGPGRWHDDGESTKDFCSLKCLLKMSRDKLKYDPRIDMEQVAKAEPYTMNSLEDFKAHFGMWEKNEYELIEHINKAIHYSRTVNAEMYEKLMRLLKEVQSECTQIDMVEDSFKFGGYGTHDVSIKSMLMHKYMEYEHKDGEDINFNLG